MEANLASLGADLAWITAVVQVMSTVVTDGKLVSMTLSDGEYVSANIIPEDESLGQQLISLEKFDLLKIHEASMYKNHLIIQNVEQLQMTREGRVVDIKKTVNRKQSMKSTLAGTELNNETLMMFDNSSSM